METVSTSDIDSDGIARAEMNGVRNAFHGSTGEDGAYQVCSTPLG